MFTFMQRKYKLAFLILFGLAAQDVAAQDIPAAQVDLTGLSLEQLLTVEVSSASKYSQPIMDAPSAVQIISREEIQLHGWRTLGEALANLPGLYINNNRTYDILGARGFQIPGDLNTRFLLLIDGQRNNDNIYQQAMIGSEGWLDISVVERIEYIPGPGSAIYGSNAMFGVINVITRSAGKNDQSLVGTYVSQLGLSGVNVMTSKNLASSGVIFQFSTEHKSGRDQAYPYTDNLIRSDGSPATDGISHGLDTMENRHLMIRIDHGEWNFKLINHERTDTPSTAHSWTIFDDPSLEINDGGTQLMASLMHDISPTSSLYARVGYTDWHYRATYPYYDSVEGYYHNYDDVQGQTLDGEFRYLLEKNDHHLLAGLEFSHDIKASQHNYYSIDPALLGAADVNIDPLAQRRGLFVQDEWRFSQAWLLSMGVRLDQATDEESSTSPRLGLIWQPAPDWTAKLLAGRAYRSPNGFESQYTDGLGYLDNANLQPETIRTMEGVLEWLDNNRTHWQLSVYQNILSNLIQQVDTGGSGTGPFQFQNVGWTQVQGMELGLEKITPSNFKLRASISGNHASNDTGTAQDNSPRWTGKTSLSTPLIGHSSYLAAELQAIGNRCFSWNGMPYEVPTQVLVNATVTFPNVWTQGLQVQFRVTNLFDRDMQNPASETIPFPMVPQYGRNLLAKLEYAF
jgi:outer membrane receptor protein involved in Fe transport